MENSEKKESLRKEQKKNFFQTFISYFRYNSKLDKKLNQSLLFNAYIIFIEIGAIIFYQVYLESLKLKSHLFYFSINAVSFSVAGFIPHISTSNMLFFRIMIILQFLAIASLIVIAIFSYLM